MITEDLEDGVYNAAAWYRSGYQCRPAPGVERLYLPSLGSSRSWLAERRHGQILLGVDYRPPQFPASAPMDKFASEVEFLGLVDAEDVWAIRSLPWQRYDLKELAQPEEYARLEYENAGNFFYGLAGRLLGFGRDILDLAAGFVSVASFMLWLRPKPFGPFEAPYYGDDPFDWVFSHLGQDYQDSGQYLLDYFEDPARLPEGAMRDGVTLQRLLARPAHEEARKRLGHLADTPEIAERLKLEAWRRRRFDAVRSMNRMIQVERARLALARAEEERERDRQAAADRAMRERDAEVQRLQDTLEALRKDFLERERRLQEERQKAAAAEREAAAKRELEERARRDKEERDRADRERSSQSGAWGGTGWSPGNGFYGGQGTAGGGSTTGGGPAPGGGPAVGGPT